MLEAIAREGLLPFKYIVADCLYGNSPTFLNAVDACVGITALVAIPSETRCWIQRPRTEEKSSRYKGAAHTKRVVGEPVSAPSTVAMLAAHLPASSWYRRQVSEGTKGPMEYAFARQRVTLCKDGLPERTVWLVVKRTVGAEPSYAYAISNAPASTPLSTFVWLSGLRWAVEQCFEESKTELGMDHYEVRKYTGWHHQMLMTMLAHFFLWHLKLRLGEKSACVDGIATADVVRRRVTAADSDGGCRARAGRVDPAAQPQGLPCT
jgi:SRSO17 transposase